MGYDIYADGDWEIPAERVTEARKAILDHMRKEDGHSSVDAWVEHEEFITDPRSCNLEDFSSWLTNRLEIYHAVDTDGKLHLCPPCGDFRNYEDERWIFEVIAPFAIQARSEVSFQGEDGYRWLWEPVKGELVEHQSQTVYGKDANAPEVIRKIVELIYPGGKPIYASPESFSMEEALTNIETIIREAGFGPHAGMSELERLANV